MFTIFTFDFIELCVPFSLPWRCPLCRIGKIKISPRESTRVVVNLRGIHYNIIAQSVLNFGSL